MRVTDIIRERLGVGIGTFAGAAMAGELPLPNQFVNRLIAERLAGHAQIAALEVQAQEGDTVAVQVVPRARLLPCPLKHRRHRRAHLPAAAQAR